MPFGHYQPHLQYRSPRTRGMFRKCRDFSHNHISELPKAAMRNVIEMYYIDCFDWREISKVLFKSNEDYLDRKESYDRRMFRYRETALKLLLTNEQKKELPPG